MSVDDPEKRGPIGFEEMYQLLLQREKRGLTARNDEQWELWGYPEEVNDEAVGQRKVAFNIWLRETHGLEWDSTGHSRLYPAGTLDPKRKPEKPFSSIKSST